MKPDEEKDKQPYDNGYYDASNWKLGLFYFNPKDKRIFPPKRLGIGWTINFANPFSILALIIVFLIVSYAFYRI